MTSGRWLLSSVALALVIAAIASGAFWFLSERKEEARAEAVREAPAEAPARVIAAAGQTMVKLDAAAQERGGIVVAAVQAVPYRAERRAYATVLDVKVPPVPILNWPAFSRKKSRFSGKNRLNRVRLTCCSSAST